MARKRKSRATRLAEACAIFRMGHDALQDIIDSIDEDEFSEEDFLKMANEILSNLDVLEVETLKEEIEEWKNNIEEKFSATQKYSDLEDCLNDLENAISEFEDGFQQVEDINEVRDRITAIDNGIDCCDNVNFPGMFG